MHSIAVTLLFLFLSCTCLSVICSAGCSNRTNFDRLTTKVLHCIDPRFILPDLPGIADPQACSFRCAQEPSCLAFAILTAPARCRRFNFGAFSRRVRSVKSCQSRPAEVFVRRLAGVAQPGGLCGRGFGSDFFGTKFKLVKSHYTWDGAYTHCLSLGGLSRLAELVDRAHMDHAVTIGNYPWDDQAWLNAYQPPGSVEPDQGWVWLGSGLPVNMSRSLWESDDPDNDVNQNRIVLEKSRAEFNDKEERADNFVLCQCVSPFD
ncbi:hypothetical protein BOX15_Mlig021632g1 [Macrostomum lignano]|uniref:C-type lectin domain-containing protein n=1 Tax=Macrostomum lignano TaxID=282301 RepID=A0A267EP21_9PLAT|nr:hypothetical protein BOX15_Mlig021632g1 [Macrostomum lignano]